MGLSTYFLATLCLVFASHRCHAQSTWRTIDAVYNGGSNHADYDSLYFFSGDRLMYVMGGRATRIYSRSYWHTLGSPPADFHIEASVRTLKNFTSIIHYGEEHGHFFVFSTYSKKFRYGRKRAFLQNGGPDAAARKAGKIYVFKGCMMAERKKWNSWGKPEDVSVTKGWPCDIDAAWWERLGGDTMVVLKGQQFWRWNADGTTSGPMPMNDHYTLMDWDSPVNDY